MNHTFINAHAVIRFQRYLHKMVKFLCIIHIYKLLRLGGFRPNLRYSASWVKTVAGFVQIV